ncbi:MAG: guanylate kinase [Candidatus Kapabacteria bacterium]|nr:guanylate kinase [Candidatus Kapabacteria bacterium]
MTPPQHSKRLIVLSAPSGAGKTTVARHLLTTLDGSRFSVSATTRRQREGEQNGRDYFFLTKDEFERRIAAGDLIEYEQIFGNYYGTLRSEIEQTMADGGIIIFDVDVKGALSLRSAFPDDTFLIYIAPPDLHTLEQRLRARSTESEEQLQTRLARAEMELGYRDAFNAVIINNKLADTLSEAERCVREAIGIETHV